MLSSSTLQCILMVEAAGRNSASLQLISQNTPQQPTRTENHDISLGVVPAKCKQCVHETGNALSLLTNTVPLNNANLARQIVCPWLQAWSRGSWMVVANNAIRYCNNTGWTSAALDERLIVRLCMLSLE